MTCKGQELLDAFKKEKEERIEKKIYMRNEWYLKFKEDLGCIAPYTQVNEWKIGFFEWKTKTVHKFSIGVDRFWDIEIKFGSLLHARLCFNKMNPESNTSTLIMYSVVSDNIKYEEVLRKITENIATDISKINTGTYVY